MIGEESPLFVIADAMHAAFGPALGKRVVLEVDGEQVEGTVTSIGTGERDPETGSRWFVELDGQRYTVTGEDLERIAGGTTDG